MDSRNIINKSIILAVFVLAGFLLARSLYYGSFIGMVCALIGIVAWTSFLYKLNNMQSETDEAEELSENY